MKTQAQIDALRLLTCALVRALSKDNPALRSEIDYELMVAVDAATLSKNPTLAAELKMLAQALDERKA